MRPNILKPIIATVARSRPATPDENLARRFVLSSNRIERAHVATKLRALIDLLVQEFAKEPRFEDLSRP